MPKSTQATRVAADTKLIAGTQKHQNNLPATIVLAGQTVTPAQVVTTLQGRIATANATLAAKGSLAAAVAADHNERSQTDTLVADYRAWILLTYRNQPDVLADYGVSPHKKPGAKDASTKVVAAAKAKATRAARHTMSKKQKAAIKGTLTGPVVIEPSPALVASPVAEPPAAANGTPQGPSTPSHA
jgi:hypothetical protein